MRHILFIVLLLVTASSFGQLPQGFPNPKSNTRAEYAYLHADSGLINAIRDTNWVARFPGSEVLWFHPGVDTVKWMYNGRRWVRSSGSAGASTWQQTLDAGSALNKMNTINGNSNKFIFDNVQELRYTYNNGYATNYSFFNQEGFKTTIGNTDGVDAGIEMLGNNAHLSAGKLSNGFTSDLIVDADSGFLAKIKTPDVDVYSSFNLTGDLNAKLNLYSGKTFSIKTMGYPAITTRFTGNSLGISDLTGGSYNGSMYYNAATKQFFVTFRDSTRHRWFDFSIDTARGFQVAEADSVLLFRVDTARDIWMPYLPDKDVSITKMMYVSNSGRLAVGDAPAGSSAQNLQQVTDIDSSTTHFLKLNNRRFGAYGSNNLLFGIAALDTVQAGGGWNVGIGDSSLTNNTTGFYNVAMGYWAQKKQTIGTWNTSIGAKAMETSVSGNSNTIVGYGSYRTGNSTGSNNTLVGTQAGEGMTTGNTNTGLGMNAVYGVTTGSNNIGIGRSTLRVNPAGNSNVMVGDSSGYSMLTGSFNTAVGVNTLRGLSTNVNVGDGNTVIGWRAGGLLTGKFNTLIGYSAGSSTAAVDSGIIIGTGAQYFAGGVSNQINIGNRIYSRDLTKIGILQNNPQATLNVGGDLKVDNLAAGLATDSAIVVNGGILKKIDQITLHSTLVPYTGATTDVNLGNKSLNIINAGKIFIDNTTTSAQTNTTITASADDNWVETAKLDNKNGLSFQYGNTDGTSGISAYAPGAQAGGNQGMLTLYSTNAVGGSYIGTSHIQFRVGTNDGAGTTMTMDQDGTIYAQRLRSATAGEVLYYNTTTKEITHGAPTVGLQRTMTATKMTTGERVALRDKEEGTMVYDTTIHKLYVWDGTEWHSCW